MSIDPKSINKATQTVAEFVNFSKRADNVVRTHAKTFYNLFFRVIVLAIILISFGIFFNVNELRTINKVLAIISMIVGAMTLYDPDILVSMANLDIMNKSLPEKFQVDVLDEIFNQYIKASRRIIAFCCITFYFLGYISIIDYVNFFCASITAILIALLIDINQKLQEKK